MDEDRRSFLSLSALARVIAVLPLRAFLTPETAAQSMQRTPSVPRIPDDAITPATDAPNAYPKAMLTHNQQQMKQDIDKLYSLVQQLKQQVDRTDSTTVLSLNLLDSVKKVEDLARQIRNLARD